MMYLDTTLSHHVQSYARPWHTPTHVCVRVHAIVFDSRQGACSDVQLRSVLQWAFENCVRVTVADRCGWLSFGRSVIVLLGAGLSEALGSLGPGYPEQECVYARMCDLSEDNSYEKAASSSARLIHRFLPTSTALNIGHTWSWKMSAGRSLTILNTSGSTASFRPSSCHCCISTGSTRWRSTLAGN